MSVLPAEMHNELAQLLDALQSADNSVRSQAEDHLQNNWAIHKPEMLLMGLVEQIHGSNDATASLFVFSRLVRGLILDLPDTIFCSSHIPPIVFQGSKTPRI